MDLRHLRYLVAVSDAGTFTRAAEQLRVAQPALTRQLNDLQNELQVRLFAPGARRATLTPAGEAAVRLARALICDAERAVERARMSELGLAGRCLITAGPLAVLSGFVATLVARIKERYPDIELGVAEAGGQQQWDAVRDGAADIGLGVAAPARYATLASEPQYEDPVDVALVAPDHPLAGSSSARLDELGPRFVAMADVGSEPDRVKQLFLAELKARGVLPGDGGNVEAAGVDDLMAQVRARRGWTFVPRVVGAGFPPLAGVRIVDFAASMVMSRVWRRSETRPTVVTVLDELRSMRRESESPSEPPRHHRDREPEWRRMPPRLELRQVRSFAAVAMHGSFGRAAAARRLSQPALSRQVRQLEQDLRVRLFERGTRGTGLTPAGETFRHDVAGLLAGVGRFHNEVKRAERGTSGAYVLGVVPHAQIDRIVSQVLQRFCCTGVGVQLGARALTTTQLGEALRKSEIDVAITYAYPMPVAQMDGLGRRALFSDELRCAMLSATHPLAGSDELSLADLRDVPFLFPRRAVLPRLYDAVMQQFQSAGVTPRVDAEYEGVQTIWTLTAQGIGWSLGTALQLGEPPAGTRCVLLRDFYLPWGAEVVYRQDETRPGVLLLAAAIVDVARDLGSHGPGAIGKSA